MLYPEEINLYGLFPLGAASFYYALLEWRYIIDGGIDVKPRQCLINIPDIWTAILLAAQR
jgi:hypothetical protein